MRGVRLNGFLASTAVALVLSAGGGALAQSTETPSAGASAVTDGGKTAPATAVQPGKASASGELGEIASPAPATAAPSPAEPSSPAPAAAAQGGNGTASESSNPAPAASSDHPEAPAAAAASPATPDNGAKATPSGPETTGKAAPAESPAAAENTENGTQGEKTNGAAPAVATPAPAAASAAPTAAPPTVADQIASELQQLSSGKYDRMLGGKTVRESVAAFYSGRSYAPIWLSSDGHANDRAKAAIDYLAHVDADGLNPADYPVPDFQSLTDPRALAEAELKFDAALITYAHHAAIGRIAWSRVDANIQYETKAPEPASVLAGMANATDVAAALDAYEPHAPGYLALKAKLADIRAGDSNGLKAPIPSGPVLKIGDKDPRVPSLREKLSVNGGDDTTYDKVLAEAIKTFQKEHDLKPTGTLTAATLDALNGPRPTHVTDLILANMERWRWMPHDLGKFYVMINLPDFTASVYNDGKRIWKTKIVIGKPDMPTPIISPMMKFITVNPTWHVPPSIINREYLPAMAQDPTVMQRMGLVVERDHTTGRVIGIYQPPGDHNAEGRLRFNFPNKFLVYQHDTPDKYMFGSAKRAFSHGCMRTQDPAKYAEVLLSLVRPHDGYTEERIKRMYGPNEINIDFPTFIPVHVTYQTAFVDDAGKLELRDDIYGRDRELLAVLHNQAEMRIADIPVEHQISASHREILSAADHAPGYGYGPPAGAGPMGFFQALFGGLGAQQPPPRPVVRRRVSRSYRPRTVDR